MRTLPLVRRQTLVENRGEQRVRTAVPEARLIYLEPDLDRSTVPGDGQPSVTAPDH